MNEKVNEMWFTVGDNTRYANLGVLIHDELNVIQVNFIRNSANWGIMVVDPDGKTHTALRQLKESDIEMSFTIDGSDSVYELYIHHVPACFVVRLVETR